MQNNFQHLVIQRRIFSEEERDIKTGKEGF
mgnify:CR=1 FL=1|jgi:hypothetical protein